MKAKTIEKVLEVWEAALPEAGLSGLTQRKEWLKHWRRSRERAKFIASLIVQAEPCKKDLNNLLRSAPNYLQKFQFLASDQVWELHYYGSGSGRPRKLPFEDACAACDEVTQELEEQTKGQRAPIWYVLDALDELGKRVKNGENGRVVIEDLAKKRGWRPSPPPESEKWNVRVEEVAKKYGISRSELARLIHERRVCHEVERDLRRENVAHLSIQEPPRRLEPRSTAKPLRRNPKASRKRLVR